MATSNLNSMIQPLSTEMQLLLHCCSTQSGTEPSGLSEIITGGSVNWKYFIELTGKHRLFPLVNQVFYHFQDHIPNEVKDEISRKASRNLKLMMKLAGELNLIHDLFSTHNIPFISLKGPLMSIQFYGDYSSRQTRDLDILIHEKDIELVIGILSEIGYQLKDQYFLKNNEKRALFMKRENHVRLFHPGKNILIEIHWAVSKYFTTINTEQLFRDKITLEVNHRTFSTLSPPDYFIILATHGIYHKYELLFWLYDIAQLLQKPDITQNELLDHAKKNKCLTSVKVSMALVHSLFNIQNPAGSTQLTKKEQFIFNQCFDAISGAKPPKSGQYFGNLISGLGHRFLKQKYFLLMTDDWQSKKRVLQNTLIKPYVWENESKLPGNNLIYLFMTQLKWLQLTLSGRLTRAGRIRKNKQKQGLKD